MNSLDTLIAEIEPKAYPVRGDVKAKYLTQTELATADAFLDIYQKLTTLKETHQLVPKEPTGAMINEFMDGFHIHGEQTYAERIVLGYKAMINTIGSDDDE